MKSAGWKLPVTLVLFSCLMAAQSTMDSKGAAQMVSYKATIPFAFVVGNQIMQPGTYKIQRLLGRPSAGDQIGMIVVRGTDHYAYTAVLTTLSLQSSDSSDLSRVLFSKHDGRRYLSEVRFGGEKVQAIPYIPTESETESRVSGEQIDVAELH